MTQPRVYLLGKSLSGEWTVTDFRDYAPFMQIEQESYFFKNPSLKNILVYDDVKHLEFINEETLFVCKDNFGSIDAFSVSSSVRHVCLYQFTTTAQHNIVVSNDLLKLISAINAKFKDLSFIFIWLVPSTIFLSFKKQRLIGQPDKVKRFDEIVSGQFVLEAIF